MSHAYAVVDVFTEVALEGNPVAVFLDAADLEAGQMQRAARELNLSETVFVVGSRPEAAETAIRIFTPAIELPFAGHPVLGTAFLLAEAAGADEVRLDTGAGPVQVRLSRTGGVVTFGEMDQPLPVPVAGPDTARLLAALGVRETVLPVETYSNGPRHAFVEVGGASAVAALEPDQAALARLGPLGVSVFAARGQEVKTRMFAPGLGVAEDPATGSAAGPLAFHLLRHGRTAPGHQLRIRQGEEIGRPSLLYARVEGSAQRPERVVVGGAAVVVARGEYQLVHDRR